MIKLLQYIWDFIDKHSFIDGELLSNLKSFHFEIISFI